MITKEQIKRILIESCYMLIFAVLLMVVVLLISDNKQENREQHVYYDRFYDIVPADEYQLITADLTEQYREIKDVYKAYSVNHDELGYVFDISYKNDKEEELHSYIGVTPDGSKVIGYKRLDDEKTPIDLSDDEINELVTQTLNKQLPIARLVLSEEDNKNNDFEQYGELGNLNDGVYYAQSLTKDKRGYIDFVQMTIENGVISQVKWDAFNTDRTEKNRLEESLNNATAKTEELWATQSNNVCKALVKYQNVKSLAMKSDGTTSIIPSVTINISNFVSLAQECISNSIHNFTEEDYIDAFISVVGRVKSGFAKSCIKTEEGYVVYSFKDKSPLKINSSDKTNDTNKSNVEYYSTIYEAYTRQKNDSNLDDEKDEDGVDNLSTTNLDESTNDSKSETYIDGEDDVAQGDGMVNFTRNVSGVAPSEIKTYIDGIDGKEKYTDDFLFAINIIYKFLCSYMRWMQ